LAKHAWSKASGRSGWRQRYPTICLTAAKWITAGWLWYCARMTHAGRISKRVQRARCMQLIKIYLYLKPNSISVAVISLGVSGIARANDSE
jgi:hypothetical protein